METMRGDSSRFLLFEPLAPYLSVMGLFVLQLNGCFSSYLFTSTLQVE